MHLLSAQHCARHCQEANKRQDSLPQIAGMESVKHSCTKERQTLSPHLCALPLGVMSPPPHPQAHLRSCLLPSFPVGSDQLCSKRGPYTSGNGIT